MKLNTARLLAGLTMALGLAIGQARASGEEAATEHPLVPALKIAYKAQETIKDNIKDYTCRLVKQERVGNKLLPTEHIDTKIRHEPFSVYMKFVGPEDVAGREVLYVRTANEGNLLAHEGKGLKARLGTVSLKPSGPLAMNNNRYPITEVGFSNLTNRLIEVAEDDKKYGECTVNFYKDGKVDGRKVTCIQVMHPVPRRNFKFHLARVYVDDEMNVPIRYEAYDWPQQGSKEPVLLEVYTYTNIKTNVGLTDADFDVNNPNYRFK